MLTSDDFARLSARGISADMAARAQLVRVDDREGRELLGLHNGNGHRFGRLDGVAIPYLHPRDHRPVTYRVRRDYPEVENGRPKAKYLSCSADARHLYFAPAPVAFL